MTKAQDHEVVPDWRSASPTGGGQAVAFPPGVMSDPDPVAGERRRHLVAIPPGVMSDRGRPMGAVQPHGRRVAIPPGVMSDPRVKSQVTPPERAGLRVDFAATQRLCNSAGQRDGYGDHTSHSPAGLKADEDVSFGWLIAPWCPASPWLEEPSHARSRVGIASTA